MEELQLPPSGWRAPTEAVKSLVRTASKQAARLSDDVASFITKVRPQSKAVTMRTSMLKTGEVSRPPGAPGDWVTKKMLSRKSRTREPSEHIHGAATVDRENDDNVTNAQRGPALPDRTRIVAKTEAEIAGRADWRRTRVCQLHYLGRFPVVSAGFSTSDHRSERSRSFTIYSGTRARGTPTLTRR